MKTIQTLTALLVLVPAGGLMLATLVAAEKTEEPVEPETKKTITVRSYQRIVN